MRWNDKMELTYHEADVEISVLRDQYFRYGQCAMSEDAARQLIATVRGSGKFRRSLHMLTGKWPDEVNEIVERDGRLPARAAG